MNIDYRDLGYGEIGLTIPKLEGQKFTTNVDYYVEGRKLSHADKIRTKNDHDLADWLAQIMDCCWNAGRCGECDEDCPMYNCCNNQSSDNIEDWLKQEADRP